MPGNPCITQPYEPSAIEKATAQVIGDLNNVITVAFIAFNVRDQIGSEQAFRRILAGYFTDKTIEDWCRDLDIQPPTI
jgi:hypothetical protein